MGLIRTRISLVSPKDSALSPMDVDALVDTGVLHLCIPEHISVQLQLKELYKREVTVADGAVPIEDMDLVISPAGLSVEVNPANLNIAASVAK